MITGGGTAGHTNPGIAIAQALVRQGVRAERIRFVGGERGNEGTLVPAAGFEIDLLPGRGIQRSLRPSSIVDNLGAVAGLLRGWRQAYSIVRTRRPSVVLCLGGYAAFAMSAAAILARVPLVVSEQNARASAVNRLMARWARVCALPYPDTDLPKGVLTGNPILAPIVAAIDAADRTGSRRELGLPEDRTVLAIWSGSLGARSVNQLAAELARTLADRSDLAIHHVVGRRDWPRYAELGEELSGAALHYQSVEYENRMPLVLTAADVAITRAGASTTSELAVAGLPAIMVPLPGAPHDHQTANAGELVEAGGGFRIADRDLSVATVLEVLGPLLDDAGARASMAAAAASVGRPDAADAVASIIIETGKLETTP
ncbi:MAG: UDP-N-acetylglucosamine--N-acetylmuramyl-(pentapeptide) pyrophosphoryl-undecaprenol N-acetylglucosamine transferase [Acidimicrobiales bacterium]